MKRGNSVRDHALVIRSYDFGEADRVYVLLTKQRGVVRAVAKGVRRARSRFGSRLQPFVELEVQLNPGRNLESIIQADTLQYLGSGLIDDPIRYASACAVLEVVGLLGDYADAQLYDRSIEVLARLRRDPNPIVCLDTFLLDVMEYSGWAPSLYACAQCGIPGPHNHFHTPAGGAICSQCQPAEAAEVDPETLHFMWCLSQNRQDTARALYTAARQQEAHRLVRGYLQWHIERGLSSLNILEQV
ncbi:MAG: DNA repair protein RecO [Corynebacterium sp.]|nr:DNA repair protein RecO [Corynebacterium sp.]